MSTSLRTSDVLFNDASTQVSASKIGQLVTTSQTSTIAISANTWTTLTGFSASITPKSSSSKILVMFSCSVASASSANNQVNGKIIRLYRNGSLLPVGDARGSATQGMFCGSNTFDGICPSPISQMYLDSPGTTSAVSYTFQLYAATRVAVVGGSYYTTYTTSSVNLSSPNTITLIEVLP